MIREAVAVVGVLQTLGETAMGHLPSGGADSAAIREASGLAHTVELLEANVAQLEQALLEPGWLRLAATAELEFTREGLAQISRLCRLMAIKNPLLRRAVAVKTYYVFGQGVTVAGKDEQVAPVIERLVDDPGNQATLFGHSTHSELQRAKMTDANLFLALFTEPRSGWVSVRDIPFDEIQQVITNPQDRAEPWYYERSWAEVDRSGAMLSPTSKLRRELYPCIDYRPALRPATYGGLPVRWDSPVLHVHSNRPRNWQFGVPELYPALDWARAHAEYLDDFRKLVKVLAKLAWSLTGVKGSQLERAKTQLANATAEDANVGQAWVGDMGGGKLEPMMRAGGVSVSPQDGRQFALMVSAATDIPETMLLGDPSTGNLATATTLDRPTELAMEWERRLWAGVFRRVCQYAIDQAVIAPGGGLSGVVETDELGRRVVTVAGDVSRDIAVDWPPIQERSMQEIMETLIDGASGGAVNIPGMPVEEILRIALTALDVDDVDTVVEQAMAQLERERDERAEQGMEQQGELAEVLSELREALLSAQVAA